MNHWVLDFDGTLVDSMPHLEELMLRSLRARGSKMSEDAARRWYRETSGHPFSQQVKSLRWAPEGLVDHFEALKLEWGYADVRPVPGVQRLLAELEHLSVVSSTSRAVVERVVGRVFPGVRFESVLGLEFGTKAAQVESLLPDVLVGDSWSDAELALRLGVQFVSVGAVCEVMRRLSA